jgi:hypothetical protein
MVVLQLLDQYISVRSVLLIWSLYLLTNVDYNILIEFWTVLKVGYFLFFNLLLIKANKIFFLKNNLIFFVLYRIKPFYFFYERDKNIFF